MIDRLEIPEKLETPDSLEIADRLQVPDSLKIPDRLEILNIWVDPVDMEQALSQVRQFVEKGTRPHCIFAVNPEKEFSIPKDPVLYEIFKKADLLIPDGIGVVYAARILHGARLSRVPGVDLMAKICELAAQEGYRIFIYGAREEVNAAACAALIERYPGLKIAGRSDGFVKDEDMPDLVAKINDSKAQILFLALGSPKQEKWFSAWKDSLKSVRVVQGIGGTLDTIAGTVKRAPEFWQKCSAEWLYRLLKEPSRIRRQNVLPIFASTIIFAKLIKAQVQTVLDLTQGRRE
ncbi:MAG: WecB/TagA/CpsF family glycosyltransferase [bacterium]